jgi:hypothetical protein
MLMARNPRARRRPFEIAFKLLLISTAATYDLLLAFLLSVSRIP